MGWKSTMQITRDDAQKVILEKIFNATDEELALALNGLFVESSHNFMVVDVYDHENAHFHPGDLE